MQPPISAHFSRTRFGCLGRLEDLSSSYKNAAPFPHLVMDNLFSEPLLDALLLEMDGMTRDKWLNVDQDSREKTRRMRSAADLGAAGSQLLGIVHSAAFLNLLSEITGI